MANWVWCKRANSVVIQICKNILLNLKKGGENGGKYYSGAVLIEKQWTGMINISKLDQLIILPSATLKSKLDTQKGIVFAAF